MTTLHLKPSMNRSPLRLGFLLIPLVLACFALAPAARALLPPPAPDGGYPGNNTAEGDAALASLTTGINNTAVGNSALILTTTGGGNTGTGSAALLFNTSGSLNTATGVAAMQDNATGEQNTATGSGARQIDKRNVKKQYKFKKKKKERQKR